MKSEYKRISLTPNGYEVFEKESEYTIAFTDSEAFEILRTIRNSLIAKTDWRMTEDYPYSDKGEWAAYRQALRDLPNTATPSLDENGNLVGVEWPVKPGETA